MDSTKPSQYERKFRIKFYEIGMRKSFNLNLIAIKFIKYVNKFISKIIHKCNVKLKSSPNV